MYKVSGVYVIKCNQTGKVYIGSSLNLEQRKYKHFYDLAIGESKNKPMQSEYDEFGVQCFTFEVVEYCDKSRLKLVEQKWLDELWATNNLYNRSPNADSPKGVKHTEETIEKFKQRIRPPVSEETKKKISEAGKRRAPPSAETREKIRLSKLGNDFGKFKKKKGIA